MPEDLPLEPDLIKVLAADTRREILGLLQERRMTVTELSRELDLGKATIHEHLNKLTDAGIVQRDEDDRLWVYYELTGRGKRLLNPQRTRFYLALASAVVAALVAGLAVWAFMSLGGVGTDQAAAPQPEAGSVALADQEAYAGEPVQLDARVNATTVDAYLVDGEAAERIRQGDLSVEGLPLRAQPASTDSEVQARDNRTLLTSEAPLGPGTYYLYVRTPEGDNAPSMPSVRLVGLEAQPDRSTWYQSLDRGPLRIEVTRDQAPVDGTLRLGGAARTQGSVTTQIEEGNASLAARLLDAQQPGTYRLSVQPADSPRWVDVEGTLTIARPSTALFPLQVLEGQRTSLSLRVDGPERLQQIEPTVSGAQAGIVQASEGWRLDLHPSTSGTVQVQLARQTPKQVNVHPTLALTATVQNGPEVVWSLEDLDEAPIEDAALYLDDRSLGFTDDEGNLTTELPAEGEHALRIHRPDGAVVHRALRVDGWDLEAIAPSVRVDPVDVATRSGSARITVNLSDGGPVPQPVTVLATSQGIPRDAAPATVPANGSTTTTLTVPVDAGRQDVTVDAEPLDPGPFTYRNESTVPAEATDGGASGGGDAAAEADATDDTADEGPSGTTQVRLEDNVTEEEADALEDQISPLEPISSQDRAVGDASPVQAEESAETPSLAPLVAVALIGVTALAVARRKP